jgi:DNA-binding PadR family transcriptional regulator
MDIEATVRNYKDRLRILLILYFFGEPFKDEIKPNSVRIFKTETRIQKIDFLIRNPDYLAFELLAIAKANPSSKSEIKSVVRDIFNKQEPVLRRMEMERFFFGAYEDIDDVISFLKSIGFIEFSSKKSSDFKTIDKQYFITAMAEQKINNHLQQLPKLQWYADRCQLIHRYFGDLSGTQLKVAQYQIDEYRNTSYNKFIGDIEHLTKTQFLNLYAEQL